MERLIIILERQKMETMRLNLTDRELYRIHSASFVRSGNIFSFLFKFQRRRGWRWMGEIYIYGRDRRGKRRGGFHLDEGGFLLNFRGYLFELWERTAIGLLRIFYLLSKREFLLEFKDLFTELQKPCGLYRILLVLRALLHRISYKSRPIILGNYSIPRNVFENLLMSLILQKLKYEWYRNS